MPEIMAMVLKQGIKCPLHRETNIRSMKCPRSRPSSVTTSTTTTSTTSTTTSQRPMFSNTRFSSLEQSNPTSTPGISAFYLPKAPASRPATPATPATPQTEQVSMQIEDNEEVTEDDEICDICHQGYSEPDDMLVFCDRCNLPVHQGCYGINTLPEGEWLCSVCRRGRKPAETRCCVCLGLGGAMHITEDGRFAHLICVYYTPELSLDLSLSDVVVRGLRNISPMRADLVCSICNQCGLGCIQCDSRNCMVSYHPYCAQQRGFLLTSDEKHGKFMYLSYCDYHSKQKEQKSGKAVQKEQIEQSERKERKELKNEKKKNRGATSTPDKKRKRMINRKKKEEAIPSFSVQLLSRLSSIEKGEQCLASDIWKVMQYYYVMKPSLSYLLPLIHNFNLYVPDRNALAAALESDQWIHPIVLQTATSLLQSAHLPVDPQERLRNVCSNPYFVIPALGQQQQLLSNTDKTKDEGASRAIGPQKMSNALLKRTQQLRFQGFDINDFGDLWEAHECRLDQSFLSWIYSENVCATTRFRPACKNDLPWLLQLNTINPTFSQESDYSSTFVEKNEFVVLAERQAANGAWIPVGMVHYYLMWYYPPANKVHGSCRAVYVCTLQRVTASTHPVFVERYGVSAERYTGSILLCLAFLHGKQAGMAMGFCDSTDNSVTFYTEQFHMKALPRGEGRHYTPMQLSLQQFDAWNVIRTHLCML